MLYPTRWKRITVNQSKVLINWLFRILGATQYSCIYMAFIIKMTETLHTSIWTPCIIKRKTQHFVSDLNGLLLIPKVGLSFISLFSPRHSKHCAVIHLSVALFWHYAESPYKMSYPKQSTFQALIPKQKWTRATNIIHINDHTRTNSGSHKILESQLSIKTWLVGERGTQIFLSFGIARNFKHKLSLPEICIHSWTQTSRYKLPKYKSVFTREQIRNCNGEL